MINLDKIQSMWQEDCKIDIDNMHEESIKVPQLHSKYHEILNNLILLRTKAQKIQKSVRHERYEYYSGCLLYTSPSPRDQSGSRMPSSA